MIRKATLCCGVLAGLVLASCGGKTEWTDSTVQGELDLASFPAAPVAVEATNEQGRVIQSKLAAGAFELQLPRGHKYQLMVVMTSGAEPIVFPRADGSLDLDFSVSSGGAVVALGAVHHFASAPPTGFDLKVDAQVSCEADEENEQEGEHEDADETDDDDVECENGVDATTGAACVDDPEADPNQPMAVAEQNAPDEIGGCADDDEEEDEEED